MLKAENRARTDGSKILVSQVSNGTTCRLQYVVTQSFSVIHQSSDNGKIIMSVSLGCNVQCWLATEIRPLSGGGSHSSGLCFVVLPSRVGSLRCERIAQGVGFQLPAL